MLWSRVIRIEAQPASEFHPNFPQELRCGKFGGLQLATQIDPSELHPNCRTSELHPNCIRIASIFFVWEQRVLSLSLLLLASSKKPRRRRPHGIRFQDPVNSRLAVEIFIRLTNYHIARLGSTRRIFSSHIFPLFHCVAIFFILFLFSVFSPLSHFEGKEAK